MLEGNEAAIVVLITAPNREEAARLAEMLIGARLAACVQILPEMESIYWWDGAVRREPEHLLLIKTTAGRFATLEREVRALHSYSTPEIVALPVTEVSAPYLAWLAREIDPTQQVNDEPRAASE